MSSTVIAGPIYIIRINASATYGAAEILYSIVVKGQTDFGVREFKRLTEDLNGRFCLLQKLCKGDSMAWDQCMEEMGDSPAKGSPLMLTDRIFSFAEIAKIAYEKKMFVCDDGLKFLAKRTAPGTGSILAGLGPQQSTAGVSQAKLLATASEAAAMMTNAQPHMAPLSQCPSTLQLTSVGQYSDLHLDFVPQPSGSRGGLDDLNDKMKEISEELLTERLAKTSSVVDALRQDNSKLSEQNKVLGVQLKSALDHGKSIMGVSDKKTADLALVNADMAGKVV